MSDDTKPTDSKMITAQRDMIARMKDAVLPPDEGPNVGGVPARVLSPEQHAGLKPDSVIPPIEKR